MSTEMRASVLLTLKDQLSGPAAKAKDALRPLEDGIKSSASRIKASAGTLGKEIDAGLKGAGTAAARSFETTWTSSLSRVRAVASETGTAIGNGLKRAINAVGPNVGGVLTEIENNRALRQRNYELRPLATARAEYEAAKSGLIPAAVGAVGVVGFVEAGNKLVKLKQDMAFAGASAHEVADAEAKAWALSAKYRNLSAANVLELQTEARGVFGSQHDATEHIDPFARGGSFLKAFDGGKHQGGVQELLAELNAAMKSGEIAGKIDPKELGEHVEQLIAMKVALGRFKIADYLTAQRAAGVALRSADDEFRYGYFPALVQENGPSAGVMAMTAFNKIVAGVGNRADSVGWMDRVGLLDHSKPGALKFDKAGKVTGIKDAAGIKGSDVAAQNFPKWAWETLKPILDKETEGLTGAAKSVRESQLISRLFPDRNVAKFVTELIQQEAKLKKNAAALRKVRKDYEDYVANSYEGQKQAVWEQLTNITEKIGERVTPVATWLLRQTQNGLSVVADWIKGEGSTQVAAAYGIVGAAAAASLSAGLLLLRAGGRFLGLSALASLPGVAGAAAVAVRGLGAALGLVGRFAWPVALLSGGYEIVTHWSEIKERLTTIWADIKAAAAAAYDKGIASDEAKAAAAKAGASVATAAHDVKEASGLGAVARAIDGQSEEDRKRYGVLGNGWLGQGYDLLKGPAAAAWDWVKGAVSGGAPAKPSTELGKGFEAGPEVPTLVGGKLAADASGQAPAGVTIQAQGPQVTFNQAPPSITTNVTVNVTTNASAGEIGSAVGDAVGRSVSNTGALHDGAY